MARRLQLYGAIALAMGTSSGTAAARDAEPRPGSAGEQGSEAVLRLAL